MNRVPEAARMGAFVLVVVGTVGLLLNEFVFDWGRVATLSFAAASAAGLLFLGLAAYSGGGKARGR